jgi:transcriptional/translational regulatory protein YebC/TACO1
MSGTFGCHIRLRLVRTWRPRSCPQCQRPRFISNTTALSAGHNKWSKIKHDKGKADQQTSKKRAIFASSLKLASKLHGPDPAFNSALVAAIVAAKKGGMPKASIEAAIARGQGRAQTGEALSPALFEVMFGGSVAIVINIESDNTTRSLKDLRAITAKQPSSSVAPTTFMFARRGRTVLKPGAGKLDFDDVLMQAIEVGAEDVEKEDGDEHIVVWTQPANTHQAAQRLSNELKAEIVEMDIIYTPKSDKVTLEHHTAAKELGEFLTAVREYDDVTGIYANIEQGNLPDEIWALIEDNLDS